MKYRSAHCASLILWLALIFTSSSSAQIPQQWHAKPSQGEMQTVINTFQQLTRAPDFPKVKRFHFFAGAPPNMQINAWEREAQIWLPVEMFRFILSEGAAPAARTEELAFLIAHEAGHAKQVEIYKTSCYEAKNIKMDKYDSLRSLADIIGAASTQGMKGLELSQENRQKQICEDHADAWTVRFTKEAGIDPSGGIRLFTKMSQAFGQPGWKGLTQQFVSDHSVDAVRIVHISLIVQTGKQF